MDESKTDLPEGGTAAEGARSGEGPRSGDTLDGAAILNHSAGLLEASAAFEQQMEQMQRWKQQLAGQMDLLRKDGLKLLERQKKLADERNSVAEERAQLAAMKAELEGKISGVQEQAAELQNKVEAAERQRVEMGQLEAQRAQVRDDMRTAEGMLEEIDRKQAELTEREKKLVQSSAEAEARETAAVALEQRLLVQEVRVREMTEQLEVARRELLAGAQKVEARNQKLEQLEQELAEQMMLVAQQTKRLKERRAAAEGATPEATASDAAEDKQRIATLTRERDTHEARIRHLVEEINQTKAQVAGWEAESLQLSQRAQRVEELTREKQAAEEKAAALVGELERANQEKMELKEKLSGGAEASSAVSAEGEVAGLRERCRELEGQLAKTAAQLKETLDFVDLQAAEAALAKTAREADLAEWKAREESFAAEKAKLQRAAEASGQPGDAAGEAAAEAGPRRSRQRGTLVRQVRSLRVKRRQNRELMGTLEVTRAELGKQLQQVRVRRENLEQVKRLLEKQEIIMARKLADHNAVKTVAAVGIFLIMILGGTFAGVYRFINPEFRGEALVQLNPPADVAPDKLAGWLTGQAAALRANPAVQQMAWQSLREGQYVMHDTREAWGLSLPADLATAVDPSSKTIAVQVKGWSAEGVAQASNALAAAFAAVATEKPAEKGGVEPAEKTSIVAKATAPVAPARDQRLMLALSSSGALMGLALVAALLVRTLITRQLKEIDQMADAKDLEDLRDDMPVDSAPA